MPVIVACRARSGICTAEFDDGAELRCSRPFAARHGIRKGAEIDDPFRDRLREAADEDLAAELARAKLRRRPRCRSELRWDLLRAGIPRPAAETALRALHQDGEKSTKPPTPAGTPQSAAKPAPSAALIRGELAARGIASADIAAAASEADDLEVAPRLVPPLPPGPRLEAPPAPPRRLPRRRDRSRHRRIRIRR